MPLVSPRSSAVKASGIEMRVFMLTRRLRRGGIWLFGLMAASALLFSACDLVGTDDEDEQQQQQASAEQEQAQQQEAAAATPAARPATQPPPEPSGPPPPPVARGGGEGERAYSIVFPSVAQVQVGGGVATGLVISQGLVLVDGAALGGATAADVLLSNGDTLADLPVVGRDALTGIAYLGPVEASLVRLLPAVRLGDGEGVRPGASVFAVGYASSDDADALPSVFSGVMSGSSEWNPGQRTLLRTDISLPYLTGGMVLIDASGTVIGVAPAAVVGGGVYISTGDLARSLDAGRMAEQPAATSVVTATEHSLTIAQGQQSVSLFLADLPSEERALLTVRTETASSLQLIDGAGDVQQEAVLVSGSTIVSLASQTAGPYEIVIAPAMAMAMDADDDGASESMAEPATYEVSSSVVLTSIAEAEGPSALSIDEPLVGYIDVVGDVDTFQLPVRAGAVYEVSVQSFLLDSYLMIEGAGIEAADDDSGGGLFNLDSSLTVAPAEDGTITLSVSDRTSSASGAYLLTVAQISGPPAAEDEESMAEEPQEDAMSTAMLPAPSPPPTISLRGIGTEAGLQATLIGLGSESVGDGLLVADQDGAFEIIVSVLGSDGALGRLTVTDIDGSVVVEGRVLVACPGAGDCLAQAIFVGNESSGGPWVVALSADEPGISEWQIEVERHE